MVTTYCLFAILLILFVIYKIKRRKFEECERSIPGPKGLPVIGHSHMFMNINKLMDILDLFNAYLDDYIDEGISRVWLGPIFVVICWDAEYVDIIANNPNSMDKGHTLSVLKDTADGPFVHDACDSAWKDLRKPIVKNNTKQLIENEYFNTFVSHGRGFIQYLKEQKCDKEINFFIPISNLIVDIFSETQLGVHTNELRETKFHLLENIDNFTQLSFWAFARYTYFWKLFAGFMKFGKERETASKNILKFNKWVLDERKKAPKKSEGGREIYSDFILRHAKENNFSEIESLRHLSDIIFGGTDTSAVTISTTLLFLAMHPEIQEEVYQEQFEIFGNSPREPTLEDINSMNCLNRAVKETLRIIAAPFVTKVCTGDVVAGKYTIPKGTMIFICAHQLHRHLKYWKEPNKFYPNHFLPEQVAARPVNAYIPFGCGRRICPAFQYGLTVVQTIISIMIRNFRFTTELKFEEITYDYKLFLQINEGYKMSIEERC